MKIERLKFNPDTLPEPIYNAFCAIEKNTNSKDTPKSRRYYPFIFERSFNEGEQFFNAYIPVIEHDYFINESRVRTLFAEDGTPIGRRSQESYLLSYTKGFSKGYWEYLDKINQSELFKLTNSDFSYKIFQRVYGKVNRGSILAKKIRDVDTGDEIDDFEVLEYIDNDLMFKQGIAGGEYYKAWELILSNPKQFESYFIEATKTEQPAPENKSQKTNSNQLQTNLTGTQPGKLFDLLVSNKYIAPSTDREGFIWAFGGKNDNYSSYSTEWLKKDNLAVYMVDCLCFDENVKIQDSYLNRMGKIFGIKNPRQTKKGYENNKNGKPDGYVLIDTIISEAQK